MVFESSNSTVRVGLGTFKLSPEQSDGVTTRLHWDLFKFKFSYAAIAGAGGRA
jgi:hypothetical protein